MVAVGLFFIWFGWVQFWSGLDSVRFGATRTVNVPRVDHCIFFLRVPKLPPTHHFTGFSSATPVGRLL